MDIQIRLLEETLLNELNASSLPIEAKRLILSDLLTMTTRQADITIKDIAKRCGVSVSTVSRALNDNAEINAETKAMILQVVQETGFVPNNSARNLKRTDTNNIAVLVKGITNPFFTSMIKIMEDM